MVWSNINRDHLIEFVVILIFVFVACTWNCWSLSKTAKIVMINKKWHFPFWFTQRIDLEIWINFSVSCTIYQGWFVLAVVSFYRNIELDSWLFIKVVKCPCQLPKKQLKTSSCTTSEILPSNIAMLIFCLHSQGQGSLDCIFSQHNKRLFWYQLSQLQSPKRQKTVLRCGLNFIYRPHLIQEMPHSDIFCNQFISNDPCILTNVINPQPNMLIMLWQI